MIVYRFSGTSSHHPFLNRGQIVRYHGVVRHIWTVY